MTLPMKRKYKPLKGEREPTPLEELRANAGKMTRAQLVQSSGMKLLAILRVETGQSDPRISTAAKLANALGVDLNTYYLAWVRTYTQVTEQLKGDENDETEYIVVKGPTLDSPDTTSDAPF